MSDTKRVVARFGGVTADRRPMAGREVAAELALDHGPGLLTAAECRALAAWLERSATEKEMEAELG